MPLLARMSRNSAMEWWDETLECPSTQNKMPQYDYQGHGNFVVF